MDESIPDIVKDIDCVQETRQHSVRIEHNWSINNVFNLIQTKRPGDKIESEQFCYENKNSQETFYCNRCLQTCDCIKSNQSKTLSPNEINITYSSQLTLNTEIICNYFLANALWRLELNRSLVDSDYMSINALLSHSSDCNINNGFLPIICQSFEQSNLMQTNLILKLKVYLLNAEMNELFERQTIEIKIDLKHFFDSLLASNQQNASLSSTSSTKYIDKYSQDKFCKTKNLLNWLNNRKSSDFCLLTEFKVYVNHHPHLETTNKPFHKTSLKKSSSFITAQTETVLIFNYKHAWVIKNWRHFLQQGQQTHTFMNESEINDMFAHSTADHLIKFGKFRSKLFSFINKNDQELTDCTDTKVDNLLKNVKWKLQLYPNGYSQEFEQNLSLFVNFSQLTGELAQFSSQNKTKLNQNNSKRIEETFYDSNENMGLILLIKSPSSTQTASLNDPNEDIIDTDSSDVSTKSQETFVKASFQISIMDSNGKRVDKCQSEKQLFELFGSWGYKEYMTAKDLNDQKDKYLSDNFKTLNLNCKIILFYTATTKRANLIDSDHSFTSRLATNSSCSSLFDPLTSDLNSHLMLSSSSSLTSSSSTSSMESNKRNKKQFITRNLLRECNTLVYDLRRVFKQSEMCDAIIKSPVSLDAVDTTEFKMFKVHKLILAVRSQVFEKMFHNEQKTNSPQFINIIDFDARTVEIFLNYLYSDRLETPTNENEIDSNDLFIELFKIADKYSVHRLKQISESKLIKSINSESCIELLILAYLHNSSKLKLGCFKYLASNVNSIVTQSSWSHLEKNYPSLLAEAFRVLYFKQK